MKFGTVSLLPGRQEDGTLCGMWDIKLIEDIHWGEMLMQVFGK